MKTIRHYLVPGVLVIVTLLLAFWIGASRFNAKPFKGFELTRADLVDFQPEVEGYTVQLLPYVKTVTEANIAAYSLIPIPPPERVADNRNPSPGAITNAHQPSTINHSHASPVPSRLLTRLVHGYNMPMCMKMKYYKVEKIQDHQVRAVADPKLRSAFTDLGAQTIDHRPEAGGQRPETSDHRPQTIDLRPETSDTNHQPSTITHSLPPDNHQPSTITHSSPPDNRQPITDNYPSIPSDYPIPAQLWKLTSSAGTVGYWVTTMIRADDFSPTTEDICAMAFPRIEIPDDPNWMPHGFRWEDLKHPGKALSVFFRSKWDGARWDVLTFLKLREPVRTSEELLSYLTIVQDLPSNELGSGDVRTLLEVHGAMLRELQVWRRGMGGKQDNGLRGE